MEKLDMHSPDLTQRNLAALAALFPNVITETRDADGNVIRAVDFDRLRQELADHVVEGPQERYQLDWPGKRAAQFAANAPIAKTLRPDRAESVDFDTTQNLFIEGDNLDALKLLQESYLGKVKLIYIDPPYNTGNDFVYEDDFAQTTADYLAKSGQVDEAGNRLVANTEANGRFHSDWLDMMYPRLKLARSLLADDGVMFISIDDAELPSLRLLLAEVYGDSNFVASLVWQKRVSPANDAHFFSSDHEYVVVVARDSTTWRPNRLARTDEQLTYYRNPDNDPRGPWNSATMTTGRTPRERPNLYYSVTNPNTGQVVFPGLEKTWKYAPEKLQELMADNRVYWGADGTSLVPRLKLFLSEAPNVVPRSVLLYSVVGHTQEATTEFNETLSEGGFSYPKPTRLMKHLLAIGTDQKHSDIVLDFFAGSATTAHAVMALNAEDGGNRQFILVQYPEITPEGSTARNAGYATIADIAKERIRRAGAKIKGEAGDAAAALDTGFRALRVDTTNKADVLRTPDQVTQAALPTFADSVKPGRTGEDLLFEVLLDWGLELTLPIARETIEDHEVFIVDDGALIACFAERVTPGVVTAIARRQPLRAVFRDSGFASDAERINAEQIFREVSPATDVKAI